MHGRGAKTPGIWSLNFFLRKVFQKIVQILFKILSVYHWDRNFDTFFSKLPKSVFQNLTVERHVSTPHILLVKITKIRTSNFRTDGTSVFDLPTNVKSASRNYGPEKIFSILEWYQWFLIRRGGFSDTRSQNAPPPATFTVRFCRKGISFNYLHHFRGHKRCFLILGYWSFVLASVPGFSVIEMNS